ncbi:MAG TPA: heavy metal translocating P-type ATPase [Tissierellales bacterium]|nr:heavy metal translocating P-type ATPase [Tissierellales bacterium]
MTQKEFILEGLNCASCAGKIEKQINGINGVEEATLDFISKKLKVKVKVEDENTLKRISNEIIDIVKALEPHVDVIDTSKEESHGHDHTHGEVKKENVVKIIVASILFAIPLIFKMEGISKFILFFASYLIVGGEILLRAANNIVKGQVFDENFLMAIATIGAFIIGEYPEGVAVMLFYQIGELFQDLAVNNSRKSIKSLLDIRPDYANLMKGEDLVKVDPNEVEIGDYIIVRPGEKIPLDGIVTEGNSFVDTSNITGESVPRPVGKGDTVLSGFVNTNGLLTVEVNKKFGESTVSKILDLVENASSKKAPTENFITKFARYYTPVVVFSAIFIAFIPPLILKQELSHWVYRALIFLVISCPCALVISIPLGFFGGIGGASKTGILIKGGNYLEALNEVDTMVFDKTGTLTKGVFKVSEIESYEGYTKDEVLEIAAYGEVFSNHPIGKSIVEAYGKEIDKNRIEDYKEIAGKGIEVIIDGNKVLLGNRKLLKDNKISFTEKDTYGTVAYIARNNQYIGNVIISDEIKAGAEDTISELKKLGVKTVMLSGDNKQVVEKVGEALGIDSIYGELLPQDKVSIFESIITEKTGKGKVAFVGDGVNDAPVLARADIGIAMGGLGSDAAIEASDVVIMTDSINKLTTGLKISNKTKKIVTQNIVFALGIKLIVLALGAFGKATMWEAVFADVGVSVIAIMNSMRALKIKE